MIGMRAPSESRARAPEDGDRNAKESEVRPGRCIVRRDRFCGPAGGGFGWSYGRGEPIERGADRPGGKGILSPPLRSPALLRRTLSPGLRRTLSPGLRRILSPRLRRIGLWLRLSGL